jgi:hypothetical protein
VAEHHFCLDLLRVIEIVPGDHANDVLDGRDGQN